MYSPQIREDLIPRVYRAAREEGIPMTTWVNRAVEKSLSHSAQNKPQPQTAERIVVMNKKLDGIKRSEPTFIIVKGDAGYRVCSSLTPDRQYVVTGIPEDPQCTCEEFMQIGRAS